VSGIGYQVSRFTFYVLRLTQHATRNTHAKRATRFTFYVLAAFLFSLIASASGFDRIAVAQAQSPITAEVDRAVLATNEQLTLTIRVTSDFLDIPSPDLSQLTDFVVVNSSTSTQVSIINGDLTTQGVFVYSLQPLREGGLIIGPISVNIDGQIYQTEPIDIRVISGAVPAPSAPPSDAPETLQGQDFFVEAEIDNPTPYLGQQITYVFKFYKASSVSFIVQPDYQPPSFTNFWSQTILSQPTYNTIAGGREYMVTEIRTALFPANLGSVTIDPAKIVIPNFPYQDIVLETEPVSLKVQSLPVGAPADFKGAIGRFEISASLSENEGVVNEPLTLIVEIKGAGNVKALVEPPLPKLPNWRVFESQVHDTVEVQGDTVFGMRRFERLIVPGQPGNYTIPAIRFSYFDLEADQYRTISTEPILVAVRPGKGESLPPPFGGDAGPAKQLVSLLAGDIRHIKPAPTVVIGEDTPLISPSLYWSAWILPVLLVSSVWVWQNRRQHLQENTAYARGLRARRAAQKILTGAQRSGANGYAAAHRALLGYLSDKLNRPTAGLTNNNLIGLLKEVGLNPALIERVETILTQIEVGRFAPGGQAAVESCLTETQRLINDLEKSFKKM
jgi:hypothetical protein